tara:strand:- start:82 stop:978 length:897 start_codon:yes stop_codon:yes gene_type:complete
MSLSNYLLDMNTNETDNEIDNDSLQKLRKLNEINYKKIILKRNQLLERINTSKNETSTRLFIVTEAYDKFNKEYYYLSLTILILSSVITFVEAIRLIVTMEYNNKILTLHLNILLLIIATIITILSSIIRFKNYREILEGLKQSQSTLVLYKNKYLRQFNRISYNYILNSISENELIKISDKITLYDKIVKSINYFQFIKNNDIIRYNNNKAKFDLKIYKIKTDTRNEFENITKQKEQEYVNIYNNNDVSIELANYNKFKKINDLLLDKDEYLFNMAVKKYNLNSNVVYLNKKINLNN